METGHVSIDKRVRILVPILHSVIIFQFKGGAIAFELKSMES